MIARDYIRRKDNHKITGLVIYTQGPDLMHIQGPFSRMTVRQAEWEKVPTVVSELTNLWRYDAHNREWNLMRDTYKENAQRWLEILQGDEPGAVFKIAKRRPTKEPRP